MANRYDRDPDDYGFGRREGRDMSRDDDDNRQGQYAQGNRFGENRSNPGQRQNPWRDNRNERDRNDPENRSRFDQDYRNNEYRSNVASRDHNYGESNYSSGREGGSGRDYYSSGRDYNSSYGQSYGSDRDNRGHFGGNDRDRNWQNDPSRRNERQGGNYRGLYQEQVWTRDPNSGNVYGYEYSTRIDPRRFNAGDESQDRWRSNVNEQNRRFDIDRGWHTPGTSGYGNSGEFRSNTQSHYGKGPKGYVRSDERIREDICDRLSDDDEIDARDITVTVKNAEVILEGTVNDRRSKHRAEDVAESVSGVKDVSNHLRARKGLLQELGDKITGDDDAEHHGHRGSGTRNSTVGGGAPVPQKTSH
jgi:osmotically-inducible protein OsmY